jgi:hypothetical protein
MNPSLDFSLGVLCNEIETKLKKSSKTQQWQNEIKHELNKNK